MRTTRARSRRRARELLARAAERAGSLGALGQARRSYEQAAELADEPVERALLLELASRKALSNAEFEAAEQALRAALELLEQTGEPRAAARVSGRLGNLEVQTGRGERGMRRMEEAFAAVSADEPDADMAYLAGRLGRSLALAGELERAAEANELALGVAQALRLPETLVRALGTKAYLARAAGRPEEELALTRHALRYALENDLAEQSANQYANLSDSCFGGDRYGEALEALGEAVALARRSGERAAEVFALSETTYALTMTGRWDEAVAIFDELPEEQLRADTNLSSVLCGVLEIFLHRGQIERSRELHSWFDYVPTEDHQSHAIHIAAQAELLHAEGRFAEAMDAGAYAAEVSNVPQAMKQGLVWTVESALALGEPGRADELLRTVEERAPGLRAPFLDAQAQRFRARMNNDPERFKAAAAGFREYGLRFWLAVTLLEHGELTGESALLGEAQEIFESLRATPWIERTNAADATLPRVPA